MIGSGTGPVSGADVIASDGDKVGTIGQVYLSDDGSEPLFVSVKTGLFGLKESFVPLDGASTTDGGVRVRYDRAAIEDAPRVDADSELTEDEQVTLFDYYSGHRTDRMEVTRGGPNAAETPRSGAEVDGSQFSRARTLEELDLRVHADSMRRDFPTVVDELRSLLGARLVAYLGSVQETRAVRLWTEGRMPSAEVVQRLRQAYQIVQLIREVEGEQIVATWMQGMNPQLGDRTPARVLREGDLQVDAPQVLAAARAFIAG